MMIHVPGQSRAQDVSNEGETAIIIIVMNLSTDRCQPRRACFGHKNR